RCPYRMRLRTQREAREDMVRHAAEKPDHNPRVTDEEQQSQRRSRLSEMGEGEGRASESRALRPLSLPADRAHLRAVVRALRGGKPARARSLSPSQLAGVTGAGRSVGGAAMDASWRRAVLVVTLQGAARVRAPPRE